MRPQGRPRASPLRPGTAPRLCAVCAVAGKAKKQRQQRNKGREASMTEYELLRKLGLNVAGGQAPPAEVPPPQPLELALHALLGPFADLFADPFQQLHKHRMIRKCMLRNISPLHLAAGEGRRDEDFIEGWTPLHWACGLSPGKHVPAADMQRVMEMLLQAGAHADAYTHDGHTPSMYIVENVKGGDAVGCLALLHSYGADLHVVDEQGRTLLMRAAAGGNVEAARWLLEQGLDYTRVDKQGRRAEHHAHKKVRKEIAAAAAAVGLTAAGGGAAGAPAAPIAGCEAAAGTKVLPRQRWRLELPLAGCPQLDPGELVWGKVLGSGCFGVVHAGAYRGQPGAGEAGDATYGHLVAIKVPKLYTEAKVHTLQQELHTLARLAAAAAAAAERGDDGDGGSSGAAATRPSSHVVEFKGVVTRRDGAQALVLGRCATSLVDEVALAKLSAADRFRVACEVTQLCDFGLSAVATWATEDAAGAAGHWKPLQDDRFEGNPFWAAPERVNCQPYSCKADVWSWGILLAQLATWCGADPFPSLNSSTVATVRAAPQRLGPEHLRPHILRHTRCDSREVRRLVSDCVQADPAERPSMREVVERLTRMQPKALPRPERNRGAEEVPQVP
ncbi:hypothetical protein HXX76_010656 [Chlamydomonas incerta]|uniref:Protein kinase domain-containing protein n=1 Tax=Chlamydomonas incerta TaxID=51695 RepID=A0A835T1K8_CHLIN|nr:hypothetical protein HXX76_010656 [Chlamydomonas incerta]|eukprot:KAG2429876.1 hypothetical protein HXX76_010656 [Chlamydomonas incerta]